MSRHQAEKAARQMIMSGYRHHTYEDERTAYNRLLQLERDEYVKILNSPAIAELFVLYAEVLGPTRMRAIKNSLICLVHSLSRVAIDEGIEVEFSFALSDYYINQLELINEEDPLRELMRDIMLHYYDLVQNEKRRAYSKPIASAVRFIGRNLHSSCPVSAVARHVGLEPHYFSALFSQQVGLPPSRYILQRKLEEAKRMLTELGTSITDVAESLGFCDVAHFSKCFKRAYGCTPSVFCRQDAPRKQTYFSNTEKAGV